MKAKKRTIKNKSRLRVQRRTSKRKPLLINRRTAIKKDANAKINQADLKTDLHQGLTANEARLRLTKYGQNAIQEVHHSILMQFLKFFWGPIPWMIEVVMILAAGIRRWEEVAIIGTLLLINASVGFLQEHKADNAIEALKKHLALKARVLRAGAWTDIAANILVPGDIVLVKLGNIIPADIKLLQGQYLSVDESALTGESLPVEKKLGEIVYSSSIACLGEMIGIVTATGMNTYFGKTTKLVESAKSVSHFQKAILKIGDYLILITLVLVGMILAVSILLRHDPWADTVLFSLILTIAAIPVALPAVLSVTMTVGALKLAKMKAIVSKLESIEELAGMDILCTDKTGTITQNIITIGEPILNQAANADELMVAAALASERESNDTIDKAIFANIPRGVKLSEYHTFKFTPFDSASKRTNAEVKKGNTLFEMAKGAPQVLLALCKNRKVTADVNDQVDVLANKGFRALGIAMQRKGAKWRYLGSLPMFDPLRKDAKKTIQMTIDMGVKVKMVTGDHTAIAKRIAAQAGLGDDIVSAKKLFTKGHKINSKTLMPIDVFAEMFPEHKFKIVKILQAGNHIVGMTGDGVNDAPTLKQADVGIAVSNATDAARAAASLILTASGLGVIVSAIQEARRIFERMISYAIFRVAETLGVLTFISLSILVFNLYPVTAVMIVLLAILNDVPIMMIAYDNTPVVPRPVRWDLLRVLAISTILGTVALIASFVLYFWLKKYTGISAEMIQSIIFLKLLVAGHFTLYVARNAGSLWARPWPNIRLIIATETTQILGTLAAVYGWFITPIGWKYALLVWCYSLISLIVMSCIKILTYKIIRPFTDAKKKVKRS